MSTISYRKKRYQSSLCRPVLVGGSDAGCSAARTHQARLRCDSFQIKVRSSSSARSDGEVGEADQHETRSCLTMNGRLPVAADLHRRTSRHAQGRAGLVVMSVRTRRVGMLAAARRVTNWSALVAVGAAAWKSNGSTCTRLAAPMAWACSNAAVSARPSRWITWTSFCRRSRSQAARRSAALTGRCRKRHIGRRGHAASLPAAANLGRTARRRGRAPGCAAGRAAAQRLDFLGRGEER